jgi:2-(1,2-epoxy-1,2-dihydrophenyl)acetyl-CoA isomerase
VMASHAYLLLAFANIGLVPDAGATWLVAKGAGRAKALEMALLGERMSADAAHAAGLVTAVVDESAAYETALAYARRLAAMPTVALGLIRKQVRAALAGTLEDTLALEAEHQSQAARTQDFQEGVAAFLQKRKPEFKGQ